jgi:hypothetical protein
VGWGCGWAGGGGSLRSRLRRRAKRNGPYLYPFVRYTQRPAEGQQCSYFPSLACSPAVPTTGSSSPRVLSTSSTVNRAKHQIQTLWSPSALLSLSLSLTVSLFSVSSLLFTSLHFSSLLFCSLLFSSVLSCSLPFPSLLFSSLTRTTRTTRTGTRTIRTTKTTNHNEALNYEYAIFV